MAFLALGINHKTASVAVRERVAFTPEKLVEALRELCRLTPSREAAILSTCNRSELYLEQDALAVDEVLAWLADFHQLNVAELRDCAYVHADEAAVRHMMRVACGLDSLVLGEPQILGQMKSAYAVAREAGTVGPLLGRLFQATFSTAKTVRTDTAIGENPVSVAFAAVSLAKQIFADLHRSQALLIGAGETITLVARHLYEQGSSVSWWPTAPWNVPASWPSSLARMRYCSRRFPTSWSTAISSSVLPPASCRFWQGRRGACPQAAALQADLHGRYCRAAGYRARSGQSR